MKAPDLRMVGEATADKPAFQINIDQLRGDSMGEGGQPMVIGLGDHRFTPCLMPCVQFLGAWQFFWVCKAESFKPVDSRSVLPVSTLKRQTLDDDAAGMPPKPQICDCACGCCRSCGSLGLLNLSASELKRQSKDNIPSYAHNCELISVRLGKEVARQVRPNTHHGGRFNGEAEVRQGYGVDPR